MKISRQSLLIGILLIVFSLPVVYPFFRSGAINTYDTMYRLTRAAKYYVALKQGQIPPRWIGDSYQGVGEPIFIYLYPFSYMVTTSLHVLKLSFVDGMRVALIVFSIGSTLTMFIFLRKFFSTFASLIGALLYIWAPYRLVQLYVRGAFEETIAYFFLPLIFWTIWEIPKRKKIPTVLAGILLGILFLTQSSVSLMFLPSIITFMVIVWLNHRSVNTILRFILVAIISFSLAAMIILPNLFERNLIQLDQKIAFLYKENFIPFDRLIDSVWTMIPTPHMLGKAHLIVLVLGVFSLFTLVGKVNKKKESILRNFFILSFAWSVIPLVLSIDTPFARFIWDRILVVRVIYVPYLLLQLAIFWLACLGAWILSRAGRWQIGIGIILALITIGTNVGYIKPDYYFSIMDYDLTGFNGPLSQFQEFLPKTAYRAESEFRLVPFVSGEHPDTRIAIVDKKYHHMRFKIDNRTDETIVIHQLYFPSWKATDGGKELSLSYTKPEFDPQTKKILMDTGFISLNLPKGNNHDIVLQFVESPIRIIGNIVSLLTTVIVLLFLSRSIIRLRYGQL